MCCRWSSKHVYVSFYWFFLLPSTDERTELLYHRLVKVLKTSDETTQSPDENKEVETGTVNFESVPSRDNNELSKNIENNGKLLLTSKHK